MLVYAEDHYGIMWRCNVLVQAVSKLRLFGQKIIIKKKEHVFHSLSLSLFHSQSASFDFSVSLSIFLTPPPFLCLNLSLLLQVVSGHQDGESRLALPALQQGIPLTPPFLPTAHLPSYLASSALDREGSGGGTAGTHNPLLQHMVLLEQGHSPIGQCSL